MYGDRPLRTVRRAMSTRTHIYSAGPLKARLRDELGDVTFEELPVRFQVCAASIERAAEHWFDSGPVVEAVVASAAVPGLLPPAQVGDEHFLDGGIVNSIPLGRAVQLGATTVYVLQVGRIDRPLTPPTKPWEVARVSFEIARRHRFARELAELPDHVAAHVLPPAGTSSRDDSIFAYRDFSRVQAKIDATYEAGLAYLDSVRPPRDLERRTDGDLAAPAAGAGARGRRPDRPALGDRAAVADRRGRPLAAAAGSVAGPAAAVGLHRLPHLRGDPAAGAAGPVVLVGFGRRIRTPYFEGIHYDLVQGTLWVFVRESRRVLNLTIETVGPTPDAHPGTPILVCCRHAGPGDSFTLIHALMHDYAREPRVVLKDTLAWDPAIGVVLSRIPARFISPNPAAGADLESQITALATGLDENDAFVIFPEGGNFTPARRLARDRPAAQARAGADGACAPSR